MDPEIKVEMQKYKLALRDFFQKQGKQCVMWERNVRSQHLQLQVCPCPDSVASDAKDVFLEHGRGLTPDFKWEEFGADDDVDAAIKPGAPYFLVDLPNGERLLHRVSGRGFPLQFGRAVLVTRLNGI